MSNSISDSNRIIIFDTTLRDGEQSPGVSMNLEEKLRIAAALEDMGVDVIEAGFPVASIGDFLSVEAIAAQSKSSIIAGLSRAKRADLDRCFEAVKGAVRPRIHTFISTSELHRTYKLQMDEAQVLEAIADSVSHARNLVADVEWSAEDASRTELDYLCKCVEVAIKNGATTINLPDTVGYAVPEEYGALIRSVIEKVPNSDKVIFSVHCHNDLGLAVANSLAGVMAGARQVECTINGIGERAGNAALEEIVMALRVRPQYFNVDSRIESQRITRISHMVSTISGFSVQPNKAIVGANAFAHESGIHQDGMLKNAQTYEIMTPESVGLNKSSLVMGKHSGRHAFLDRMLELGYTLDKAAVDEAFVRFKALADRKKDITDEDLIALVDDAARQTQEHIRFESLQIVAGTKAPQTAELELVLPDGKTYHTKIAGNGPIDAAFKAIGEIYAHPEATLQLFQVHAITEGTDAQAEVTVRLSENGRTVNGQGADPDTIVAAVRAYIHALNKLIDKRQKSALN